MIAKQEEGFENKLQKWNAHRDLESSMLFSEMTQHLDPPSDEVRRLDGVNTAGKSRSAGRDHHYFRRNSPYTHFRTLFFPDGIFSRYLRSGTLLTPSDSYFAPWRE